MSGAALVLHGGGPTAVLNASLAGLALALPLELHRVPLHAARFGMDGLLSGNIVPLDGLSPARWEAIRETPASAIGSSRRPLTPSELDRACDILQGRGIRWIFPTGGNGTQRMALALYARSKEAGSPFQVIGIPKTIDNDIPGTWCTPGYGSVARQFAFATRDLGLDNRALPSPVTVLETLGRDTGWVTAATVLARTHPGDAPHLVYLPESRLSLDYIATAVDRCVKRLGRCVVTVCEGLRDETGQPFGADVQTDRDGIQRLAANLGHTLARLLADRIGVRVRSEKPGLTARCGSLAASQPDRALAEACGRAAARYAREGLSGVMVALDSALRCTPVSLETAASGLRPFPEEWILDGDIAPGFLEYCRPLTGAIPPLPDLLDN